MLRSLALLTALVGCDVHTHVVEDPCAYRTYYDPTCDRGFLWTPGHYDPAHVWVTPRYVRRTTVVVPHVVTPPPIVLTRPTYATPRPTAISPTPYRRPVTTTTTVRSSSSRPVTTVTTTRRYR